MISLSRYGWFSYTEPETFGKLSTSTPIQGFSQYEEKGCRTNMDGPDAEGNKTEVGSEAFKEMNLREVAVDADNVVNGPADSVVIFLLLFLFLIVFFS